MARATPLNSSAAAPDLLQPAVFWSEQCMEGWLRAQQLQLEAFEVQSAIVRRTQAQATAVASELWDQWIAHWGGGVPVDG